MNSKIKKCFTLWLSRCIINILSIEDKQIFRKLEKDKIKLIKAEQHIKFNEQCIQHNLFPIFTNINICICICVYVIL